jgi:hypothetical protein
MGRPVFFIRFLQPGAVGSKVFLVSAKQKSTMKNQLNCRAVTVLAVLIGVVWLILDSLTSGAMGRGVGWENIPLNLVIAGDVLLWIVGLSAFRAIDRFTLLGATVMAGFMLFLPHLAASLRETEFKRFLSPAAYNALVLQATIWTSLLVFALSWVWDWSDIRTRRQQAQEAH